MSLPTAIDFRNYVQSFRVGAPYARPLARMLLNAAPADLDDTEKKQLRVVTEISEAVQDVVAERDRLSSARVRPVLAEFVNRWGAIYDALSAMTRLPRDFGDRGKRASKLVASLLPDGIAFVKLDALAAWNEAQRVLDRIGDEDLKSELEALTGADYLAAAKKGTAELGEAIGVGKTAREIPSSTALQEKLLDFSRAVGAYGRLLAARVDETDAASVERFRKAVAPIDQYRSSARSNGGGEPIVVEPSEPTPPEPEAPSA